MNRPQEHHNPKASSTEERRIAERKAFDGQVTVSFADLALVGPGRNISASGVYFVTAARPHVMVHVEGRAEPVAAELVRIETLGDGQVGVAVRFLETL